MCVYLGCVLVMSCGAFQRLLRACVLIECGQYGVAHAATDCSDVCVCTFQEELAKVHHQLHMQLWAFLPGFCNLPTDTATGFKSIARTLGLSLHFRVVHGIWLASSDRDRTALVCAYCTLHLTQSGSVDRMRCSSLCLWHREQWLINITQINALRITFYVLNARHWVCRIQCMLYL